MRPLTIEDDGLQVLDLKHDAAFLKRKLHQRDMKTQLKGLQRLSTALLESPETALQELVNAAVDLCGADSAGISIEKPGGDPENFYHWIATAGSYSGFLNAVLPQYPSACGLCLERGNAQHFTVYQKFFDILKVDAPLVLDGILLPWEVEGTRGTIFVMSHTSTEAFDENDADLMRMLADFAAMGFKQQGQLKRRVAEERLAAAVAMANDLAHQINNPLQSMTNLAYLLEEGHEPKTLGEKLSSDLDRLSVLVSKLLSIPLKDQASATDALAAQLVK